MFEYMIYASLVPLSKPLSLTPMTYSLTQNKYTNLKLYDANDR